MPVRSAGGGRLDFWNTDHYHASKYGCYLEALVLFGAITGVDPRTLGRNEPVAAELGIVNKHVGTLQTIAWETLQATGTR